MHSVNSKEDFEKSWLVAIVIKCDEKYFLFVETTMNK